MFSAISNIPKAVPWLNFLPRGFAPIDGLYQLKHYQVFPMYVEKFLTGGGLITARQWCHPHISGNGVLNSNVCFDQSSSRTWEGIVPYRPWPLRGLPPAHRSKWPCGGLLTTQAMAYEHVKILIYKISKYKHLQSFSQGWRIKFLWACN